MKKESRSEPAMPAGGFGSQFGRFGADRFGESKKPKNTKGVMRRIVKIYLRWGKAITIAMLMTLLTSCISIAVPYYVGRSLELFEGSQNFIDTPALISLLLILALLHAGNWLISTVNGVIMLKVSQKLVFVLRSEFFSKLQRLPLGFFDTRPHGDTMSRLTNDVDEVSSTVAQTTTNLCASLFTLAGSLIVMISLSWQLTLVVMLVVPLVALLTRLIAKKSRFYFLAQARNLGALNGIIEENIIGLKLIKAFDRKDAVMQDFDERNIALYHNAMKANIWSGYMMPMLNVINNLIYALVALAGGYLSVSHGFPMWLVVTFLAYSKQFAFPLNNIAGMFSTIQSALAGAERVFEIMDSEEETPDLTDAVNIENPEGRVTFENTDFEYIKDVPVLRDINFDVQPGETVALVGETGAGKTTIVNLLTRFYDATSGTIKIDGIPIASIKRSSLRKCFSVVLQDTCLFTGTIADNIRYGKPEATDGQVAEAAKLAHAHEFIISLPDGYNTIVSGSTDSLSEGQRQLLAIARAALCDNPILILDEATSSVDTKTEKDIQRALIELMSRHTTFLIAHRLSTIRDADKIIVINNGSIEETGSHEALMKNKGHYYDMVVSQLGSAHGDLGAAANSP